MEITVTHSEEAGQGGGWTGFRSFIPDWISGLNNRLFTVKNGQLWLHNQDTGVRNNFYGVQYDSSITAIFNDSNSDDKIFKTVILESDDAWKAELTTNYTESIINKAEFNAKESRWFAYIRKNEDETDLRGHTAQGVGVALSISGLEITFSGMPDFVNINDNLYQLNGSTPELIGTITAVDSTKITVNAITTTPLAGLFFFAKKDPRIEGSEIRGKVMTVKLTHEGGEPSLLHAVNTNISKSYV